MRGSPIIKVENDKNVFALFAAMNAMGYDDENRREGMFRTRKIIRNIIGKRGWDRKYPTLKKIIGRKHPWQLLYSILSKQGQATISDRMVPYLNTFLNEPEVQKAWQIYKIHQSREIIKLSPLFRQEFNRIRKFLGVPPKISRVIFITNFLDAFWRGYSIRIKDTIYLVIGPGAEKNDCELIRHEILHAFAPQLSLPKSLTAPADHRNAAALGYQGYPAINREYVVRGSNLLYESRVLHKDISKSIKTEKILFPSIEEVLTLIKYK